MKHNDDTCNASGETRYPLTVGQKGIWLHHQLEPLSDRYNIPFTFTYSDKVSINEINEIINIFVNRHSILRSTFHLIDGVPMRETNIHSDVVIKLEDASLYDSQQLSEQLKCLTQTPFDLEQGPLIKAFILQNYKGNHILLMTVHHLIFDGASLKLMFDEFELIYQAMNNGSQLKEVEHDYDEFRKWQTQFLNSEEASSNKKYWLDKLIGVLPQLDFQANKKSNKNKTVTGRYLEFAIPTSIVSRFKELATQCKCSEYIVWIIVYFSFLSRYTAQKDIIVGTPSMGRPDVKFDDIIGCFINLIPLRCQFEANESLINIIDRVKNDIYEALMNADYPLPTIINALGQENQRGDQPLFQTSFVWAATEHFKTKADSQLGLTYQTIIHDCGVQDLTLELRQSSKGIIAIFKYRENCFPEGSIMEIKNHFINFIQNISKQPELDIQKIDLLSKNEKLHLLHSLNNTQVDYPESMCIHQLFEQQVVKTPDNIALQFANQTLSYKQLNQQSNQLAHYLIEKGIQADNIVGLYLERSLEMLVAILATLKAGAAYLPLDPDYPQNRLLHMLNDSHLSLILSQQKLQSSSEIMRQKQLFLDDEEFVEKIATYPKSNPMITGLNSRNLAYVIYTSGSTGLPKGVMVEHKALVNRIDWMQNNYQLRENDVVLQKTPYSFDVSVWELTWFLTVGARLVMALPNGHKDPDYLIDVIQQNKVTVLHFVPSMLRSILANSAWVQCDSLRQVFCSGEALTTDIARRHYELNEATLHNLYGPTEAAIDVSHWQVPKDNDLEIIPIGKPIQNTQLLVLNEQLRLQPNGVAGELYIGGAGLARGYINQAELTQQRFMVNEYTNITSNRLYRTGDLVQYLEDGNLAFLGRIDNQVKIRGFRIELGEIEQQLRLHSLIESSVVIVVEDSPEHKYLVAYLSLNLLVQQTDIIKDIRKYLQSSLPDYMIPLHFVILDSLPLTSSGKINRKALPKFSNTEASTTKYIAPKNETESKLCYIWADLLLLSFEDISTQANFFKLGGDSLIAIKLLTEIKSQFSLNLNIQSMFEFTDLAELAIHINALKPIEKFENIMSEDEKESFII